MSAFNKRKLYLAFASLALSFLIPTTAFANTYNWQGPYAGVYLGGGFGNNHVSTDTGSVADTSYFTTATDINAVNSAGSWTKNPSTMIGGIQVGHDWVWKQMVYGVALDYSSLSLSSSTTTNATYPDSTDQYSIYTSMRTNWLFTLRGRVGYQNTFCLPSLFYLTGGMAMTQLKVSNSFSDSSAFAGTGGSSTAQNQIGWTAGAGVEVAALNHISVDFEYLYVKVPSVKTSGYIGNTQGGFGLPVQSLISPLSTTANFHANIFKIGLNYRFDE